MSVYEYVDKVIVNNEQVPIRDSVAHDELEQVKSAINVLDGEVFEPASTSIIDGALSLRNTDIQISAQAGDTFKLSVIPNGKRVTVALCVGTSFVDDPTQYVIVSNSSDTVTDLEYAVTTEYKCLHLYMSSTDAPASVVTAQLIRSESRIDSLSDAVSEIYDVVMTSVYDDAAITLRNTDVLADVRAGDELIISCTTNGNLTSFALNPGTSFDSSNYVVVHDNSTQNLDGFKYSVESGTFKSIHIWQNQTNNLGIVVTITINHKIPKVDDTLTIAGVPADAKATGDAIGVINEGLFETTTYSIANNRSLSSKNTDIVCDFQDGDTLKVTCNPNGQTLTLALCVGTSFVDDPSQYTVLYNSSAALSDRAFSVNGTYKCLHIWHSTTTAITLTADRIRNRIVTIGLREDVDAMLKTRGRRFACFGDSITSDQATGIGTAVSGLLECNMIGNFACGYAVGSDWHNGATVTTPISLTEPQNTNTADNVLSNQVLRCLQYTTAEGEQITWTHPIAGSQSIATSYGTGLGHTDEKPDILYIAIGINDGNNAQNTFTDDSETVMATTYANLTKCSLASALRWAIETLQSAYPNAQVFVAAPLFTTSNDVSNNGQKSRGAVLAKRECIKKIANYCNATFIDSTFESGYTVMAANVVGDLHPNAKYKAIIARYIANEIRNKLCIA